MEDEQKARLFTAVDFVKEGNASRLDGKDWSVYRSGTIIRIDLKGEFEENSKSA